MSPAILIAGSTSNTGTTVVETLSQLVDTNKAFAGYKILALTRNKNGATPRRFAKLLHVQVVEKSYTEVTADWLRQHEVKRSFIASQAPPHQFSEESEFNVALLKAGVEYHVQIATAPMNMRRDNSAYYARSHWAVEQQLNAPEFEKLKWTSIRPNLFMTDYLKNAVEFVKKFRETGEQGMLRLAIAEDMLFPVIHPGDVGVVAAHLLMTENPAFYNRGQYTLNGPENTNGAETLELVGQAIGTKVKDVRYKDISSLFHSTIESAVSFGFPRKLMSTIYTSFDGAWQGEWNDWPTSEPLVELGIPL
ncbi:uncharacterized protein A1O9_07460 [Exophiala aquamarina CBS 119918]|uniref:Uncharacterized protein n=1 Tax=Exophiala aquamarina CBS 119918 TaxID=1182545 RepID=A0A072PK45_9EURO|nr:uncharacterized protein A1O9_07460 [Exophiala aquamarina CBS 119918]KEF55880.1 hypothetical protein A1O9_07460 [Exophiala aquamarina CBS 119918]